MIQRGKLSINRVAAWPEAWRGRGTEWKFSPFAAPDIGRVLFVSSGAAGGREEEDEEDDEEEEEALGFQLPPRVSPTRKLYRAPMMHRPEMAEVVPGRKCATYVGTVGRACVYVCQARVIPCLAVIQIPPAHK